VLALHSHLGPDGLKRNLEALKEERRETEEYKQAAGDEAGKSADARTFALRRPVRLLSRTLAQRV
jgi:hypothetical protein